MCLSDKKCAQTDVRVLLLNIFMTYPTILDYNPQASNTIDTNCDEKSLIYHFVLMKQNFKCVNIAFNLWKTMRKWLD